MLRWKGKKIAAGLMTLCLLLCTFAFVMPAVYAEPTDEPATVENAESVEEGAETPAEAEEMPAGAPVSNGTEAGIVVAADEEEEEGNIMDTLLKADRVWLGIFKKIMTRLFIVLAALVAAVVLITIYIMVTQTTRVSKQNKALSRRPSKAAVSGAVPNAAAPRAKVTEFGDTLRIRRTAGANSVSANMQRPVAPQRPSRPQQSVQPGVRRPAQPMQGQPARRPASGQPVRSTGSRPVQPSRMAQPIRQPQRPAANAGTRPVQAPTVPAAKTDDPFGDL